MTEKYYCDICKEDIENYPMPLVIANHWGSISNPAEARQIYFRHCCNQCLGYILKKAREAIKEIKQ